MSFLQKIKDLNSYDPDSYARFSVAGKLVGAIRKDNLCYLRKYPDVFVIDDSAGVRLADGLHGFEAGSMAVAEVVKDLARHGAFAYPLKEEQFPVVEAWGCKPLLEIDRAATPFFGLLVFGVHVNGFTLHQDGLHMWLGRRGAGVKVWAGRYDQMVAGGQPIGISLEENLIKEGMEEAQLLAEVMSQARPCAEITYSMPMKEGIRRDTLFVYDLELPPDLEPCADGAEVGGFELLPISEVARLVRDEDVFKPNCNLVVIDFLMRHGFLQDEPDLEEIRRSLKGSISL